MRVPEYPTMRTLYPRLFCRLRGWEGLRLTIPFVALHMPACITGVSPRYHKQRPKLNPAFQTPFLFPLLFSRIFVILPSWRKNERRKESGDILPDMRHSCVSFFSSLSRCARETNGRRKEVIVIIKFDIEFLDQNFSCCDLYNFIELYNAEMMTKRG